jgi:hypothetical protein
MEQCCTDMDLIYKDSYALFVFVWLANHTLICITIEPEGDSRISNLHQKIQN